MHVDFHKAPGFRWFWLWTFPYGFGLMIGRYVFSIGHDIRSRTVTRQ